MHPDAAETATLRNWMEIMTDLPWSKSSADNLDLQKAEAILNEDHYGLEKVKDRIIEALAVRKTERETKGPILCLVGPPGVGKTSLGRSVARALGRKFVRLSLGGVHDEAEFAASSDLRRRDAGTSGAGDSTSRHKQSTDHA
jgi:ATP-dependent Lon protease